MQKGNVLLLMDFEIPVKRLKKANDKITLQINVRKSIDYFSGKRYNV